MRAVITGLILIIFGWLFKSKITRRLKRICIGHEKCSGNTHAALGGTYHRNFATFNNELTIAFCTVVFYAIKGLIFFMDGFHNGNFSYLVISIS